MRNVKFIIVTDKPKLFQASEDRLIVSPREFIGSAAAFTGFKKRLRLSIYPANMIISHKAIISRYWPKRAGIYAFPMSPTSFA